MRKIITISKCKQCNFVKMHILGNQCMLMKGKPISFDYKNTIPSWCPLQNAPKNKVKDKVSCE